MQDIEALGKKLQSIDAEERREAAVDLGRAGKQAVPLLLRAMADKDWRVRKTAVEALVAIEGESVIIGLIEALKAEDNAGARNSAIEALAQIGGPALEALLPALATPDPDVRKFIVDILGDTRDPRAVPALIDRLVEDVDENIRVAAAEALGKIRDPRAVDALLACLNRHNQGWLDYAAAEALGEIGEQRALGTLLAALDRSNLREPILEALGKIGNVNTIDPLVASLADALRIVREVSIVAIDAVYRKSSATDRHMIIESVRAGTIKRAVDLLEETLVSSTGDLQKAAIALLGWIGRESSIRKLLSLLNEEELRDSVADSLAHIDKDKAGFLFPYLTSDNALVRRTIAEVLGEVDRAEVEERLIPLLRDENGHVRSAAANALGRLRSRIAVTPLLDLLGDEYENVQEAAIHALASIGDESVLDGLTKDFSSRDAIMRRNIVLLLGKFSTEKAVDALAFALKDEEPDVRKAVVSALANASGTKALRPLLLAVTDDDPEVRMPAAEALGAMDVPEAREALITLLADTDLWVQATAARGLGRIGGAKAGEVLMSYLGSASDIFLLALVEVLGILRYAPACDPLLKLADHQDPEVRKTVLAALAGYEGDEVLWAVLARLSDPHWSVRKGAVEALKHRCDASVEALLAKIAEGDPDPAVRQAANEALGR
ncbi:MAG: HEAT repeat domain-containing protein [Nitrospirae bacterium]|nr:HEAT repeat domain-containing protein [Nitrospirota bacterium]